VPNFRIKTDVIPGRFTTLWFEATEAGDYPLLCTEFCGKDHSNMLGHIKIVETEEEWHTWLDTQSKTPETAEAGQKLYQSKGCNACHTVDGSKLVGPSFKGLYGKSETTDHGNVTIDDAYITESILTPNANIVSGFTPAMPPYQGQLKQDQINALIAYIKTLK
jgi:cytochrome c oxidase subunit 2